MPKPFRCRWRGAYVAALLALSRTVSGSPTHAEEGLLEGIQWGESQSTLLAHLGARATVLPSPIDFGDSYTQIVLRNFVLGGVPLIAFFQIDKATRGLKRIQLERQRHGVNPPAFRGEIGGLGQNSVPRMRCAASRRARTAGIRPLLSSTGPVATTWFARSFAIRRSKPSRVVSRAT